MKKLLFVVLALLLIIPNFYSKELPKGKNIPSPTITVAFAGEIGIPKRDCRGFGFGCLDLILEISFERITKPNTTSADIVMLDPNTMSFTFKPDAGDLDKTILIEKKSINLFQPLAKSFGRNSIVIIEGTYAVQKQSDGRMTATIKVISK
jgi:hypothetical protein